MTSNKYIYCLYAAIIPYFAYTYLWNTYGLAVTDVVQYILLGLMLLGMLLYFTKAKDHKNSFANWLIVLMVSQSLAFFSDPTASTTQFKEMIFVTLSILPFVSQLYNPKHFKYVAIIICIISIWMFFYNLSLMRLLDKNSYGGGYMSLIALPVGLYFLRNKKLLYQTVFSAFIFILVLMSMKRGDILACIVSILIYFVLILKHQGKLDTKVLIALFAVGVVGYLAMDYLAQTSDVFAWRLQQTRDGDSSERDLIYGGLIDHFKRASFTQQVFGEGFNATVRIADTRAHSDWIELLLCEGILGCIIYFACILSLLKNIRKRNDIFEKAILSIVLSIWIIKSIFSMFIFSQSTIMLFVLTGYILNNKIDKQYEI